MTGIGGFGLVLLLAWAFEPLAWAETRSAEVAWRCPQRVAPGSTPSLAPTRMISFSFTYPPTGSAATALDWSVWRDFLASASATGPDYQLCVQEVESAVQAWVLSSCRAMTCLLYTSDAADE